MTDADLTVLDADAVVLSVDYEDALGTTLAVIRVRRNCGRRPVELKVSAEVWRQLKVPAPPRQVEEVPESEPRLDLLPLLRDRVVRGGGSWNVVRAQCVLRPADVSVPAALELLDRLAAEGVLDAVGAAGEPRWIRPVPDVDGSPGDLFDPPPSLTGPTPAPLLPEMHCTRCGKWTSDLDAGGGDTWYCKRGCHVDPVDPAGGAR